MCFSSGPSAEQQQQQANQTADRASRDKYAGQADKAFGYFTGSDPTKTGLYKTLMTNGIQATNQAYDNAKAANRLHSRVAGFGYEQPLTQASDQGVENGRAAQLSDVPRESLLSTIGPELQAATGEAGIGSMYNSGQMSAGTDATTLERQRMANQSALMKSLIGGATGMASMFLPGLSGDVGSVGGVGVSSDDIANNPGLFAFPGDPGVVNKLPAGY